MSGIIVSQTGATGVSGTSSGPPAIVPISLGSNSAGFLGISATGLPIVAGVLGSGNTQVITYVTPGVAPTTIIIPGTFVTGAAQQDVLTLPRQGTILAFDGRIALTTGFGGSPVPSFYTLHVYVALPFTNTYNLVASYQSSTFNPVIGVSSYLSVNGISLGPYTAGSSFLFTLDMTSTGATIVGTVQVASSISMLVG